jgi:hypothetical protein
MSHFYRFNPDVISEGSELICWAASLESWLKCQVYRFGPQRGTWSGPAAKAGHIEGATWIREILTKDQIIEKFADDINADHSLKPGKDSMLVVAANVGMDLDAMNPASLTLDYLTTKLKQFGHLYITYFSVVMRHAVVGYGVSTTDGVAVMDPKPELGLIHRQLTFFQDPSRLKEVITIGWPVPASS